MNTKITINDLIEILSQLPEQQKDLPIHSIGSMSCDEGETRERFYTLNLMNGHNEVEINIPANKKDNAEKFDVVLQQIPLSDGLTASDINNLLSKINTEDYKDVLPLDFSTEGAAAVGFIRIDAAESLDFDYHRAGLEPFIRNILSDTSLESPDNKYEFNGLNIYMSY